MSCIPKVKVQILKTWKNYKIYTVKVFPFSANLNFSTLCTVHGENIKYKMLFWLALAFSLTQKPWNKYW